MRSWLASLLVVLCATPTFAGTISHVPGGGDANTVFTNTAGISNLNHVTNSQSSWDTHWTVYDLDDAPGIDDGFGADPVPFPASWASTIYSGVLETAFTYMLDPIHTISAFNPSAASDYNNNLNESVLNFEYGYQPPPGHSGAQQTEFYWQITPATHLVVIAAAGGSGAITIGDNITFSDGAVCRAANTDGNLAVGPSTIRMWCVNHTPPGNGATISSCSGNTCTGPPAGTVSGSPFDEHTHAWRPMFFEFQHSTNQVNLQLERGPIPGTTTDLYWMSMQSGDGVIHVGKGQYLDTHPVRVSLPALSDAEGYSLLAGDGDVAIDTTNGGTNAGNNHERTVHTIGGQWLYTTGSFVREAISATDTHCFQKTMSTGDTDIPIPFFAWQKIEVVAIGLRNDVTANASITTPVTITLKDIAGNAISTDSAVVSVGKDQTVTFVTTAVADDDSFLNSGEGMTFSVSGTPNPSGNNHTLCIAYKATRT